MSLTYGFFNSLNGDRKYDALQMSQIFDGIIMDGVYEQIGNKLMVRENSGMMISIDTGRAWFNHTWTYNDALLPLTLEPSELVVDRIDAIVLDVDSSLSMRRNDILIVKGTPSSTPNPPTLIKDDSEHHWQYPLAYILVKAGVEEIKQADITNRVGSIECPFVTGPLKTMSIDAMVAQWEGQFMDWFSELDSIMEGDPNTNLIAQINKINRIRKTTLRSENWTSDAPYTQSIPMVGFTKADAPFIQCIFDAETESEKKQYQKEWGFVDHIETDQDLIIATCKFKRPTIDLPIVIKGR